MQPIRFKEILKSWMWYNGKRFRRRFSNSISMMNGYGGAGYNIHYYGITKEGKRIRINGDFNFRYDSLTKEVVVNPVE